MYFSVLERPCGSSVFCFSDEALYFSSLHIIFLQPSKHSCSNCFKLSANSNTWLPSVILSFPLNVGHISLILWILANFGLYPRYCYVVDILDSVIFLRRLWMFCFMRYLYLLLKLLQWVIAQIHVISVLLRVGSVHSRSNGQQETWAEFICIPGGFSSMFSFPVVVVTLDSALWVFRPEDSWFSTWVLFLVA